jgi:hypothetical protein
MSACSWNLLPEFAPEGPEYATAERRIALDLESPGRDPFTIADLETSSGHAPEPAGRTQLSMAISVRMQGQN